MGHSELGDEKDYYFYISPVVVLANHDIWTISSKLAHSMCGKCLVLRYVFTYGPRLT